MSELELLSHIAQPALTLAGMRVEFCNPAALAAGFVPGEELTLPETEGNAAAVMEHAGARYGAQLLGNVLLLTPLSEEPNLTGEQLENICAALRSPLSDLLAGAEVLFPYLEEQEDRMIQTQTARITRAYYRLVRAVSLMQSERALAAGLEQGNFAVTELCGFFAPLFSMTEGFCAEKGVKAQLSLPSRTFTAAIDPELLERAYYQLLSNALKAMGPGGSLSVRLEERESYALLTVQDTGTGLSPEAMLATGQTGASRQGLGFGLEFARRVAELHGGSLLLQSQAGEGTKVLLRIALRPSTSSQLGSQVRRPDYSGGLSHAHVELSDVMPDGVYDTRSL